MSGIRLLVVDDDPDMPDQVRRLLRSARQTYQVIGESRIAGLDLGRRLAQGDADACLLDHAMGGRMGTDLLRGCADMVSLPPVVVLTGSHDPAIEDAYLALGAADLLGKDEITPRLLDRTIRYALRDRRQRRGLEEAHEAFRRSERVATLARMAAGVAHEFNNLNAVILGNVERLQRRFAGDGATLTLLDRIIAMLERSRAISQVLFQLGRTTEEIPAASEARQILELSAAAWRGQGREVRLRLPDIPVQVRIDASDLRQLIDHLLRNAVDAVWRTPEPRIELSLAVEPDFAVLRVSDNGIGIVGEDLPLVTEPFFSRKGPHDRDQSFAPDAEGAGLGLSVCRSIVERVGGTLAIASTRGGGTIVNAHLRLAGSPGEAGPTEPDGPRPLRIAVVEDNPPLLELLCESLAGAGMAPAPFDRPEAFLDAFARGGFDVVVLDWQLPGLDGAAVLQRLADPRRSPALPVIVLSGANPHIPDPLPEGVVVVDLIGKPFRMGRLITALARVGLS
jgi:signal transduction histidine kinase